MISDNSEIDDHNPPSISSSTLELSPNNSTSSRRHKLQLRINSKDLEYDTDGGSVKRQNNHSSSDDSHSSGGFLKKLHHIKGGLSVMAHHPHLDMEKSFNDLKQKLFHGKGIKKLKSISKRRRQRKKSSQNALRKKLGKLMNSRWAMIIMLLATIYLLFIDDFMLATGAPDDHVSFTVVSSLKIVVFIIFVVDLFFSIYVQRLFYVLSFYFPIDLISMASLIPDIISFIFGISSITHAMNSLSISRTARVARIASRLSRISKIINFFNLLQCSARVEDKSNSSNLVQASVEPSSIGKQLLSKTSHKVMLMALLIVLVTVLTNPQFDTEHYNASLLALFVESPNATATLSQYLTYSNAVDILYLKINNTLLYETSEDVSIWFYSYIERYSTDSKANEIWVSNRDNEMYLAALAICLTVCLIIILLVGILLVSRDFQLLVIKPIERMISLIKKISSMDRGHDSEYDSETDDYSSIDNDGINMTDTTDLEGQFYSEGETESYDGYHDEPETNIIVELLNDIALKKHDIQQKEKTVIEVHAQIRSGFDLLGPAIKSWLARKAFVAEQKKYSHRARIIKELIQTEQTLVSSLNTCIEEYLIPLRVQEKPLLTMDQLNEIFCNIEVIHEFNKGFLKLLDEKFNNWTTNHSISDVFQYLLDGAADVYAQYVNNYNAALKIYEECKKDEKFLEHVQDVRDNKTKGFDLVFYLIMPIQRMPRYVMLLEDLHKHTHNDHHDRENIENTVRQLKKLTVVLNERKRDAENKSTIRDIYMQLVPPEPDILSPGNALLVRSKLKQDSEKYIFFLFQNGLLKTEEKDNELHVIKYIPIKDSTSLTLTPLQECPSMKIHNAFQLKIDQEMILLFAKTPEIRTEWVNAIGLCTKVQHQRTKSTQFMQSRKLSISRNSISSQHSPNMSSSRLSVTASNKSGFGLSSSNLSATFNNSNNNNNNNNNK
ncbi:pleckstrin (PH) domain-containing protein [Tieghemostelium lacteum]|uniref:Pleckstrin (PH) domain-containing protein n=1 Tax=Tieghemostelium lacteum TaxID=361077 RepID=A0A151ZD79_TIELA|nr:pleckstrin (PH) domain-containing protein [Tieghemostelium lacteum]|eukprot:KYQ91906.1 pleckstrin (PH) domain-containing protein [Tieghemostelium lacteum]